MDIRAADSLEFLELLKSMLAKGRNWLAYEPSADHLAVDNAYMFRDHKEASAFCNKAEEKAYEIMPLAPIFVTVMESLAAGEDGRDPTNLRARNIHLDMAALHYMSREEILAQQQVESMLAAIEPFGFQEGLDVALRLELYLGEESLVVKTKKQFGEDKMAYELHFGKDNSDDYHFMGYYAALRRPIDIPAVMIGGIDTKALDALADSVNWDEEMIDGIRPDLAAGPAGLPGNFTNAQKVLAKLSSLEMVAEGQPVAALIKYKHWEDTPNESAIPDLDDFKNEYSSKAWIGANPQKLIKDYHARALLTGKAIGLQDDFYAKGIRWTYIPEVGPLPERNLSDWFGWESEALDSLGKLPLAPAPDKQELERLLAAIKDGHDAQSVYRFQDAALDVNIWQGRPGEGFVINVVNTNKFIQEKNGLSFIGPLPGGSPYYAERPDVHLSTISNNKFSFMETSNLELLLSQLKFLGFGEKNALTAEMENQLKLGKPDFQLFAEGFYQSDKKIEANLHFRRSGQGIVFFNKYDATLKEASKPENDKSQTFFINRGHGVTLKEAFNLLDGRAVFKNLMNKEGGQYQSWLKLDFANKDQHGNFTYDRYTTGYNFDLEAALSKHAIVEMNNPTQKEWLLKGLMRGNLQQATLEKNGVQEKVLLAADPKFKQVIVHREKGASLEKGNGKAPDTEKKNNEKQTRGGGKGQNRERTRKELDTEEAAGRQTAKRKK